MKDMWQKYLQTQLWRLHDSFFTAPSSFLVKKNWAETRGLKILELKTESEQAKIFGACIKLKIEKLGPGHD